VLRAERGVSAAAVGHLAMLLFSALVAGSFSLGALAANEISPLALSALRFVVATVLVGGLLALRGQFRSESLLAAARAPWRYALLGGIYGLYFVLMFEGLKTAPPVSMAAVFTLTPLASAGLAFLLLRQLTSMRIALALLTGALGALQVIFRADISLLLAFAPGRGEVIFFVACVTYAAYAPLAARLSRGEGTLVFSFFVLLGASVMLLLVGAADLGATPWRDLPAIVWVTLIYTSVAATAVTVVLLQYASLRLPASKVMAYTYLLPSWVILWEVALGQPLPAALVFVGVGMSVLALGLLLRAR
jgi:drug/metabolite transporter (DMT)-like permease